ncbi:MAG TPA: DUF6378 domain-containing protein [Moraxellaceae bacterium]|nr:DUF6378 domain-containing protein [Moraxellaceae bacterium]
MKAPDILAKAAGHMRDRAATYDKPEGERSMARAVAAFNTIHGTSLTVEQGWHFMAVLKQVRLFTGSGYHADSLEDLVAYCALLGEEMSSEPVIPTVDSLPEEKVVYVAKSDLQVGDVVRALRGGPPMKLFAGEDIDPPTVAERPLQVGDTVDFRLLNGTRVHRGEICSVSLSGKLIVQKGLGRYGLDRKRWEITLVESAPMWTRMTNAHEDEYRDLLDFEPDAIEL